MADSRISVYEDQENRVPSLTLRGKKEALRPLMNNAPQRSAFGVLSSQNCSANLRVQPSRSAKQGISYDGGAPKFSQDENAYCRSALQKSTTSSTTSGLSCASFKIYSDESANSSKAQLSGLQLSNSNISCSSRSGPSDKTSLQYAASKLDTQIPIPECLTALPRLSSLTCSASISNADMMELSVTDEESSMSVTTPNRSQEDLLKIREEKMWDMMEYAADIYNYLRDAEKVHRPRLNYMSKQNDISVSMRWILVDWMVEVAEEYNQSTETLYLAVSYVDRFLSHMSVKRDKLQLVGTTAMFIASKYEEIYPPDVGQFAYITDNTYKVTHILRMEHLILKVLSFDMAVPTAFTFINKFARTLGCTELTLNLALFIAELTMLDPDPFLRFLPSEIASTSLAIANFTQGYTAWPTVMVETYHYTLEDLRECYVNLNRTFGKVHEHAQHSIREKYKDSKRHNVSGMKAKTDLPF